MWTALTQTDALRGEFCGCLTTPEGQRAWLGADGSEARLHAWLAERVSGTMKQLLAAIRAYERLARLLTDAFDEMRWRMTEERAPVPTAWLGDGPATRQAAELGRDACTDALGQLGRFPCREATRRVAARATW